MGAILLAGAPLFADTFTVTSAADSGAGSLREAITNANDHLGFDTIAFDITGDGIKTILPATALPPISDPVLIDGYSQPGTSENTLESGNNAILLIQIGGANLTSSADALTITTSGGGSTIRGLVINGGFDAGIQILDSSNNLITGCFLGTDPAGQIGNGNTAGVLVESGENSSSNLIGGTTPATRNLIAGNSSNGVGVGSGARGVSILGNSIFGNGALGIDLNQDGVTLNDEGDADTGANNLQNFPTILQINLAPPYVNAGTELHSTPNTTFHVEFFANERADASGFGEGQIFLGAADISTDESGRADYGAYLFLPEPIDPISITATATDPDGNTSEFSAAFGTLLNNISTRLNIQTGDNVLIGGFIIAGSEAKTVVVRGIGTSLGLYDISGFLEDPILELHEPDGTVLTNDNWRDTQEAEIMATGTAPRADLESALIATLAPGAYTTIVKGKDGGTGLGLVEVYDIDPAAGSKLANISTRGLVGTGDNVMIGGFSVGPDGCCSGSTTVLVRAIGPSLSSFGIADPLQDPTLELFNGNGALVMTNDDWKDTEQAEIEATGIPPTDDREAALVATVVPGLYTAIVRGKDDSTGVGLVEVYDLH